MDELIPLRKDVAQQTQRAEKHVEAAERQYSTKVKELRDNFNVRKCTSGGLTTKLTRLCDQAVNNGFQNLETRITEVGRTTVRVGAPTESRLYFLFEVLG